jgi:hypothetical protein
LGCARRREDEVLSARVHLGRAGKCKCTTIRLDCDEHKHDSLISGNAEAFVG